LKAIERVRVSKWDGPFRGRILNVSSSSGGFETPTRVPNSRELNAKIQTHFDEPWDNLVFEVANRFADTDQVSALHRRNGAWAHRRRSLAAFVDRFSGYAVTKYFPQLPVDARLSSRDIHSLVDLQLEAGLQVVSVPEPYPTCTPDSFEQNLKRNWEYIERTRPEAAVMPYISVKQKPPTFRGKLDRLRQHEKSLWAVGIRFGSPFEYRPNYFALAEFSSRPFWVHCSGVRRYVSYERPVGQLHALDRFGIDTVSAEIPQPPTKPSSDWTRVRYFDRRSITYPRISEASGKGGRLPCDCVVCKRQPLESLVGKLKSIEPSGELTLRVNDASRVHEVYSSTSEFEVVRDAIRGNAIDDYFRAKTGLADFSFPAKGQTRLPDG
jgi:hypothetical protein